MTLSFHWFLPTYGDSRHIVGGGHGLHTGTASGGAAGDASPTSGRSRARPSSSASSAR